MTIVFGSEADNWGNTDPSMSTLRWMELTCEQDLTCTSNSPLLPSFLPKSVSVSPSFPALGVFSRPHFQEDIAWVR